MFVMVITTALMQQQRAELRAEDELSVYVCIKDRLFTHPVTGEE